MIERVKLIMKKMKYQPPLWRMDVIRKIRIDAIRKKRIENLPKPKMLIIQLCWN